MKEAWLYKGIKKMGVHTFKKTWKGFKEGFGDLNGDKMWYGLKALNCFAETGQWELRIDLQFERRLGPISTTNSSR